MDDPVPMCCFCFKIRDDRDMESGEGPWVDLKTYAVRRDLSLSSGFLFTHIPCPHCVADCGDWAAASRPANVSAGPGGPCEW